MKRPVYLFLAILFASAMQLRAQQMAVALSDGNELKFAEGYTSCKITFSDGQMLLHVDGAVKNTIGIKDINRIYFYSVDASVDELLGKEVVVYSAATEELLVHAQPGTAVAVYQVNGMLALSRVQTIASTPINVAHLPAGTYVAVVGNVTLKFVKR